MERVVNVVKIGDIRFEFGNEGPLSSSAYTFAEIAAGHITTGEDVVVSVKVIDDSSVIKPTE